MAESVDATDLKSVESDLIPVRVRARAPLEQDQISYAVDFGEPPLSIEARGDVAVVLYLHNDVT